ncbi:hypothetical protein [Plantactinospora sonchi]|uniref:Uncharacterized protein n=1 Tax=Plantactinospora sonchi TaxID=1544735 RepID=A0ABU7S290_9ACTN
MIDNLADGVERRELAQHQQPADGAYYLCFGWSRARFKQSGRLRYFPHRPDLLTQCHLLITVVA